MSSIHVYVGLGGDTDPGRYVSSGLYRSVDGAQAWESIGERVHPAPQVRAILTDPARAGWVMVGTQEGIWRSTDHGDSWRKLAAPKPGLAVWSLVRHPARPQTIFAGYEPAAIVRSDDDGETWRALPLTVTYPHVTAGPEMPKRVLGLAFDPSAPDEIYAAIEIGGLLRSLDGGQSWTQMLDGLYTVEDSVDLHAVAVSAAHPGRVTVCTRVGAFRSDDRGAHWRDLKIPLLRPKGSYCRTLAIAPDDPSRILIGGGNDFDADVGALFESTDDGGAWRRLDLGDTVKTSIFGLAIDPSRPERIVCSTKYGWVFRTLDRGRSWALNPLPVGAGHVFSLGLGP
jgi:photosystem II stability/assembly factor-like uncharacterized protein